MLARSVALLLAVAIPPPPARAQEETPSSIPPQVALGRRADLLRMKLKASPTVVIVSEPAQYVRVIARWSLAVRFPVLIDDGSDRAREDIARFVRAFEPLSVVRWNGDAPALPKEPAAFRSAIDAAAWSAWGASNAESLAEIWMRTGFTPFGVVVAAAGDPAWTAALALAAGRGQPIIWIDSATTSISDSVSDDAARHLDGAIAKGLDNLARPWTALGDEIDSLTLCLNRGATVDTAAGPVALTDRLGRGADGSRAAWAGLLHGSEPVAAYRAMCALFLQPTSVWLFDGYAESFAPPYAVARAVPILQEAGLDVASNAPPVGGLAPWRLRTEFGVKQELIHVNSSGHATFFDLAPGRALVSDIPLLHRPAMVNFIHSFSARWPADARTIAGRWLENGAYCYAGSMDEPFLGAFLPPEIVFKRMLLGAPFAAAVRQDDRRVWKINIFGDPLATLGRPAPRHETPLTLDGAIDLKDEARTALKAMDLPRGVRLLVMLGRDEDAMRIARASLADDAKPGLPDLAAHALTAAFRLKQQDVFFALFEQLASNGPVDAATRDLLWQAARNDLETTSDADLVGRLRLSIRDESLAEDAEALAPAIGRVFGPDAARTMYASLVERTKDDDVKARLRTAAAGY
jgi:hypothetical protein